VNGVNSEADWAGGTLDRATRATKADRTKSITIGTEVNFHTKVHRRRNETHVEQSLLISVARPVENWASIAGS